VKRFKKIRWNGKEVALEWTATTQDGAETHDHQLTCKDAPHPEFDAALQALKQDVLVIAELDDEEPSIEIPGYGETMRVQSVSLSLNAKSGNRGAVVTAMKTLQLANAPLALHTPHLVAETDDDEGDEGERAGVMPAGMWARIEALEKEAWAYLDGKRAPKAQQELPLSTAPEPELEGAVV
jgi:hypothetical protein